MPLDPAEVTKLATMGDALVRKIMKAAEDGKLSVGEALDLVSDAMAFARAAAKDHKD